MSLPSRVYIVSNHTILRAGLRSIISCAPDLTVVGDADVASCSADYVKRVDPTVILHACAKRREAGLDDAIKVMAKLRPGAPHAGFLVLVPDQEQEMVCLLMEGGATGVVLERAEIQELLHAVRMTSKGLQYFDPSISGRLVAQLLGPTGSAKQVSVGQLSAREAEVLRLVAQGHGYREIAAMLRISIKTVETHKSRAMLKLDLQCRADIVRYAIAQGWLG